MPKQQNLRIANFRLAPGHWRKLAWIARQLSRATGFNLNKTDAIRHLIDNFNPPTKIEERP